jgi:hypothetical protein
MEWVPLVTDEDIAAFIDEVVACHVRPSGPDFDPTVLEAEIVRRGDVCYWCLAESLIGGTDSTWIGGRRLSWRIGDA